MAANPVLPDSNFYIDCLRAGPDPLIELRLTAATRDLVVSPVVRCEVGRGIRSRKVPKRLPAVWNVMIRVPTDVLTGGQHFRWVQGLRFIESLED